MRGLTWIQMAHWNFNLKIWGENIPVVDTQQKRNTLKQWGQVVCSTKTSVH